MKKTFKDQKGYTFVELILYMGIFSMLMLAMFQLLTSIFDVQIESQSTANVPQDGRYIMSRFSYDIGRTQSISSPSIGTSSASLKLFDGTTTNTYSLSNGNLILTSSPSGSVNQLNSFNTVVSNLSFLRLADNSMQNDTVTISYTVTSRIVRRGGFANQTYKTTIGIRKN